ncbi:MAG: reprolysin-like metallopeptidase [Bacteroidota bacterium]
MIRVILAACMVAIVALAAAPAQAQTGLWSDVSETSLTASKRSTLPQTYRLVRLDEAQMAQRLEAAPAEAQVGKTSNGTVLTIPMPDGREVSVRVVESSILAPALQAKFPQIRTYLAQGGGAIHGRLSYTPKGFRGMLFAPGGTVYIDPYVVGQNETYVVYRATDLVVDPRARGRVADEVRDHAAHEGHETHAHKAAGAHGDELRTYRLAMAASGEFTQFHGGTVADGLAAIVTTVNRVTGIYERDLSVRFELIANNDQIVYTNAATDPYRNNSGDIDRNRTNLSNVIGNANFDVGHVVTTNSGGVAYLGVVCNNSLKAGGTTGLPNPVGDAFDVDYVAHELGHQFGGNHTFNGDSGSCSGGNRNGSTAYEPGSGSTIQAYAGICGNDNLQNNSDPYFHGISLDEMTAHVTTGSGGTCGTVTSTGNTIPTVTAPSSFTIPAGTPFMLTGSATDDTPGSLTYTWEEFDLGPQADVNANQVPFFRSFEPTNSPTRTFPQMSRLLAGQNPVIGEKLPTGNESLTFRLTARDNRPGGGAINDASTDVEVIGSAGPFTVTFASTSGQSYSGTVTVTWNVAGTASGAVNTPNVEILFSDNGGASFDYTLTPSTPNDGSASVTLPNVSTSQGRILVKGVGNVFFNVNPQPFSVTPSGPPAELSVSPASVSESVEPGATGSAAVNVANGAGAGAAPLNYAAAIQNESTFAPELAGPLSSLARPFVVRSEAPKGDRSGDGSGPLARLAGGPDAFGYEFRDSDEADGPAVNFQDISGSGSAVTWTAASSFPAADEGYADIALPFSFPFYGNARTSVRVFSNGFLTFDAVTGDTYTNGTIPASAAPNAVIAPFWDDLDASNAAVYTGTLPDGRFVVQYDDVPRYNTSQGLTFQVILSPSGGIEVQYGTMNGTLNSATVGIESDGGTDGLQVVRNSGYVASNKAILFEVPTTWITVSPANGTIQPGNSDALTLDFDASELAEGTYTADLVITSNDPVNPTVTIPVTLTVEEGGTAGTGPIVFTAPTAGETLAAGTSYTVTWSPGGVPANVEMKLLLKSPTEGNSTIERKAPNTGSYSWSIPSTQGAATDYRIVGVYTDPSTGGTVRPKTGDFEISGGVAPPTPITVTAPASGAVWATGTTETITWNVGDVPASTKLQIRVLGNGGTNTRIAKNVLNDGEWVWDIPASQAPNTDYRVMLVYDDPDGSGKVKPKSDTFEISATAALAAKSGVELALGAIAPNPTRGAARVPFTLAEAGEVRVAVYDVQGREVAVLAEGHHAAGSQEAIWAAGDLAPGVYVVRLATGPEVLVRRAVVVR